MPKTPKPSQLELEVPVFRNADEWSSGAEHLADMLAVRDGLVDDLRTEVRKRRKEIKARDREISNIAMALREGRGNRDQQPLFKGEAKRVLAEVHKHAEGGNGTSAPLPVEPHVFIPAEGRATDECVTCGSGKADPVHVEPKPGTIGAAVHGAMAEAEAIDEDIRALGEDGPGNGKAHARRRPERKAKGRGRRAEARA